MKQEINRESSIVSRCVIKSDCDKDLSAALKIAFNKHSTVGFFSKTESELTLYWPKKMNDLREMEGKYEDLPFPLTKENGFDFVLQWFLSAKIASGTASNGVGFELRLDKEAKHWSELCTIRKVGVYYGK